MKEYLINRTLNTEGIAQNNQTKTGATHTRPDSSDKSRTIPKNINFYRHLIDSVYANESGVEWVLKLRSPTESDLHKKLDTYFSKEMSYILLEVQQIHRHFMGKVLSHRPRKDQLLI